MNASEEFPMTHPVPVTRPVPMTHPVLVTHPVPVTHISPVPGPTVGTPQVPERGQFASHRANSVLFLYYTVRRILKTEGGPEGYVYRCK